MLGLNDGWKQDENQNLCSYFGLNRHQVIISNSQNTYYVQIHFHEKGAEKIELLKIQLIRANVNEQVH